MNYLDDPSVPAGDRVIAVYIGLLGRTASFLGLDYWKPEVEGGLITLSQLSQNIVDNQKEYADLVAGKDREARIRMIYNNLFGREPEQAGLDYWLNSSISDDGLAVALINGASSTDRQVLDSRIHIGNHIYGNPFEGVVYLYVSGFIQALRDFNSQTYPGNTQSAKDTWDGIASYYRLAHWGDDWDYYFG